MARKAGRSGGHGSPAWMERVVLLGGRARIALARRSPLCLLFPPSPHFPALSFVAQHAATGKSPLAALGEHLADPWAKNFASNGVSFPMPVELSLTPDNFFNQ